jgi:hypothetical protein
MREDPIDCRDQPTSHKARMRDSACGRGKDWMKVTSSKGRVGISTYLVYRLLKEPYGATSLYGSSDFMNLNDFFFWPVRRLRLYIAFCQIVPGFFSLFCWFLFCCQDCFFLCFVVCFLVFVL